MDYVKVLVGVYGVVEGIVIVFDRVCVREGVRGGVDGVRGSNTVVVRTNC